MHWLLLALKLVRYYIDTFLSYTFIIRVEQRHRSISCKKCLTLLEKLLPIFIVAVIIIHVFLAIYSLTEIFEDDN